MATLTGIYAHPDDETFSAGGTFAKYARAGVRCTLFTATDGDAGKTSGLNITTREELARTRRKELFAAAEVLGIARVETAGHPDGALGGVDQDALIGAIVAHLRTERPDVVITFGPEGAPNAHRDHKVICRAATAAFFLAAISTAYAEQFTTLRPHSASRLFYITWREPRPGDEIQLRGLPATAAIDVRDYVELEVAAFRAHATQQMLEERFVKMGATAEELFALASGVPQRNRGDLFDGLPGFSASRP